MILGIDDHGLNLSIFIGYFKKSKDVKLLFLSQLQNA